MKLLKKLIIVVLFLSAVLPLSAKKGMYLLTDVPGLMPELRAEGCDCTAEKIYAPDGKSLANQVPHFGGGCSSEIVSPNGLLLTNYHCAHGAIQSVSSVKDDYLTHGFWAANYQEELPVEGLTVRVPVKVEDVTEMFVNELEGLSEAGYNEKFKQLVDQLVDREQDSLKSKVVSVKKMLGGTKYVLFVSKTYRDIRLVGAPPVSLGKFGGDRDNWMWPRHTADFSFLRIYADKDGNPVRYDAENVPLKTPDYIHISLDGVEKDDLIFIIGYPGMTDLYSTSYEVKERRDIVNEIRHKVRTQKLAVIESQMDKNDTIRIKYSANHARVSNYWKHAKAQNAAFARLDVASAKEKEEEGFMKWVNAAPERKENYGEVLSTIEQTISQRKPLMKEYMLQREALGGSDLLRFLSSLSNEKYIFDKKNKGAIEERAKRFYKNMDEETEVSIIAALLKIYFTDTENNYLPEIKALIDRKYKGNYAKYAQEIISKSPFKSYEGYEKMVAKKKKRTIKRDKLCQLAKAVTNAYGDVREAMQPYTEKFRENQNLYKKGVAESATELLAPDANSTIRFTMGKVQSYLSAKNVMYPYETTIEGVMEKYRADSDYYTLPEEFIKLYEKKDFGRYAKNGTVPACFISTAHTTGGNSGSPTFNKKGQLIGLLFDGSSEGLSGDYYYDDSIVRSIIVDIRYVLFITEKLGKSEHIIKDLNLSLFGGNDFPERYSSTENK